MPLKIHDALLLVDWYNANEGYCGDFDPSNPENKNLLRFDVCIFNGENWEAVDDSSYCTHSFLFSFKMLSK